MKQLSKCEVCGRYMFTISQHSGSTDESDWRERMKYCSDCWLLKINKAKSLRELEAENTELPESEKQRQNTMEEYNENNDRYRRYKAN